MSTFVLNDVLHSFPVCFFLKILAKRLVVWFLLLSEFLLVYQWKSFVVETKKWCTVKKTGKTFRVKVIWGDVKLWQALYMYN